MNDPLHRLFWVGRLEGVSFLLLLGVAMPLKYLADLPQLVTWVGWAHGLLFVGFIAALGSAHRHEGWSWPTLLGGLAASVLPTGTFVLEARLRKRPRRA
ncbi:MAG: DUF3817 domain-containing protein [Myxococcales bacterium]|nr:DUF3817 domain-containing protein [Myxococcales bacterium]MCB9714902.1 DUF3817 domain-containing protein [Myxococcales bacterium]